MVVYETISGRLPFHQHTDLTVFMKVMKSERPTRGAGFAESLWKVLAKCWAPQPNDRPSIEDVLQCLDTVSNSQELSFEPVEETGEDSDEEDSADNDGYNFPLRNFS